MSSFIFNNYLEKSNETNKKVTEFLDKKDLYIPNIYNVLNTIPSNNIIFYFFIVLLIYAFLKNREIRLNEIFIFLICILVLYLLIQKDYVNFLTFTDDKKLQIKFLEKLMFQTNNFETAIIGGESLIELNVNSKTSYLYYDPIIIEFYYNIRDVIKYNISSFIDSLLHTNNLLRLSYQSNILKENLKENYEQAIIEKKKSLNSLSYLVFNMPVNNILQKRYKDSLDILHTRLNGHINNMSILFKDITTQKNKDPSFYLPSDTFEKNNETQPFDKDNRKSLLTCDLY